MAGRSRKKSLLPEGKEKRKLALGYLKTRRHNLTEEILKKNGRRAEIDKNRFDVIEGA